MYKGDVIFRLENNMNSKIIHGVLIVVSKVAFPFVNSENFAGRDSKYSPIKSRSSYAALKFSLVSVGVFLGTITIPYTNVPSITLCIILKPLFSSMEQ